MPDRELPEHLSARLSDELTSGAPLVAPLPAQARYARPGTPPLAAGQRWRLVTAIAAAAALVLIMVAASPTPARQWIGDSVGNLTHELQGAEHPGASKSPERSPASQPSTVQPAPHDSPEATESPEPSESPEPNESPEPSQTPESHESPEPSRSPDGGDRQPSPSPRPSDGDSGGGGGTSGGGG